VHLYIFDRFDEIGEEIKTGGINLFVCPICKYRGWLWDGLIVIDRARGRGVFVADRRYHVPPEELLDRRLEDARRSGRKILLGRSKTISSGLGTTRTYMRFCVTTRFTFASKWRAARLFGIAPASPTLTSALPVSWKMRSASTHFG
jgi:hypothetical protein